jgi:hypothetical protein
MLIRRRLPNAPPFPGEVAKGLCSPVLTHRAVFPVIRPVTTFDRYLLYKYLHVYVILFVTLFGLFVVIDGFSNVDGFQQDGQNTLEVLTKMASYYAYQSSLFFDMIGSILSAIAVLIVFSLLQRHSEIHPILAAGIPTFRLLVPVLSGTLMVNTVLVANQELVIPRISHMSGTRGVSEKGPGRSFFTTISRTFDQRQTTVLSADDP